MGGATGEEIGGDRQAMDGEGGAGVTQRVAAVIDSDERARRAMYRQVGAEGAWLDLFD